VKVVLLLLPLSLPSSQTIMMIIIIIVPRRQIHGSFVAIHAELRMVVELLCVIALADSV